MREFFKAEYIRQRLWHSLHPAIGKVRELFKAGHVQLRVQWWSYLAASKSFFATPEKPCPVAWLPWASSTSLLPGGRRVVHRLAFAVDADRTAGAIGDPSTKLDFKTAR